MACGTTLAMWWVMRNLITAALLLPLPLLGQTATQALRLEVRPISAIQIRGTSVVNIPMRQTGSHPVISKSAATYAVTTNEVNRRIMVAIDAPMPDGTTLTMTMAAPSGGRAIESVALSTTPQTAVTGISLLNQGGLAIEYSVIAAPGSVVKAAANRTVSLTLVSSA